MERLFELTKALHASMQLQQQQLLQQKENLKNHRRFFKMN